MDRDTLIKTFVFKHAFLTYNFCSAGINAKNRVFIKFISLVFCVYINRRDNITPQLDYGFSVWNFLNKNYIIIHDLQPYLICDLLLGGYNAPASHKFVLLLTEVNWKVLSFSYYLLCVFHCSWKSANRFISWRERCRECTVIL